MIKVDSLKKVYSDGKCALDGVSFTLDKKITSIIGQNGAGKTTLLRILSTQLRQTAGSASINGFDIEKDANKIRKMLVSIPQEAHPIYYHNTLDSVRLYLSARGMGIKEATRAAEIALKKVGLFDVRYTISNKLSGGMKRKIFVAMALASDADIVFLDEPTTALDPLSRLEVWSAIKMLKGQVILTTHYMEEAQALSDEVLMMDKGKILAQGKVDELLKPLDGMVRVESNKKLKASYKVANTYISYVKKKEAESFVIKGDVVKPITLDDLFIKNGVNLES
jgi:ABC-2 type transport system ATP-binding protein